MPDRPAPDAAAPDPVEPGTGESAPTEYPGRARLRAALLRPGRNQLVVGLLLGLVGYAGVTQVRFTQVDNTYAGLREQDLVGVLNGLAGTSQRAQSEIARLEHTRDDLLSSTGARDAALAQAQQEADALAVLAGVVPVTGPGIRVTITEQEGTVDAEDFVDTIQELRTAGAEAIQVNGEVRVVADTAVDDVPGGLLVGGRMVTPPYVVDAIGEPTTLTDAGIDFPDGPRDLLEKAGASVQVDQLSSLDIESVVPRSQDEGAAPGSPTPGSPTPSSPVPGG